MDLPEVARATLTIGVTGHRASRLASFNMAVLAAAIDVTLNHIASATVPAQPFLITALADGADTIAAECALARGWHLTSVLPFSRQAYQADFTSPAALASYRHLLSASQAVIELPGVYHHNESPAAYEHAGRIVLARCDILLAVWDGRPAQGRGGTAQIVAEAVVDRVPVIHIDPAFPQAPVLLWHGPPTRDPSEQNVETSPRQSLDALPLLIGKLLARK